MSLAPKKGKKTTRVINGGEESEHVIEPFCSTSLSAGLSQVTARSLSGCFLQTKHRLMSLLLLSWKRWGKKRVVTKTVQNVERNKVNVGDMRLRPHQCVILTFMCVVPFVSLWLERCVFIGRFLNYMASMSSSMHHCPRTKRVLFRKPRWTANLPIP